MRNTFHRDYRDSCKGNKDNLHIHKNYLEDNPLLSVMMILAVFHFGFQPIFEKQDILNFLKLIHSMLIWQLGQPLQEVVAFHTYQDNQDIHTFLLHVYNNIMHRYLLIFLHLHLDVDFVLYSRQECLIQMVQSLMDKDIREDNMMMELNILLFLEHNFML